MVKYRLKNLNRFLTIFPIKVIYLFIKNALIYIHTYLIYNHLPIQNLENIFERTSSFVISPVISPR